MTNAFAFPRVAHTARPLLFGAATVREVGQDGEILLDDDRVARTAASCLILPQPGDSILCLPQGDDLWVLAVLARATEGPVVIHAPALSLSADQLRLEAADALHIEAPLLDARVSRWRLAADAIEATATKLTACLTDTRWLSERVEALADSLIQRCRTSTREIIEQDITRAGNVSVRAKDMLTLHGAHSALSANGLAKINGEQVHIG